MTDPKPTWTRDQVSTVLNSAADDVLNEISAGEEGARDAVNLAVNLALSRLDNPDVTVEQAILDNYEREEVEPDDSRYEDVKPGEAGWDDEDLDDGSRWETDDETVERVLDWCGR